LPANPGRRETESPIRTRIIVLFVQLPRRFEFLFHFRNELQRTERLGPRQLAEIHREIIMRRGRPGRFRGGLAANRDAFIGELLPLIVVPGELGPIETCASKLPRGFDIVGVASKLLSRLEVFLFSPLCELRADLVAGD
jgi:hypothetical protein